jgi:uncharacterized protein with von Willebrand factor type A (vWA) domain
MTYREQLHPWCVVRCLPNLQSIVIGRFRRRSEAEAHLQLLHRMIPTVTCVIIFDAAIDKPNILPKANSTT